jgi:hypothetical protein
MDSAGKFDVISDRLSRLRSSNALMPHSSQSAAYAKNPSIRAAFRSRNSSKARGDENSVPNGTGSTGLPQKISAITRP